MEKTPQIKPVGKADGPQLKANEQPTGFAVPVIYSERSIVFNEKIAEGKMEGRAFSIHLIHDGTFAVKFEGLKGESPQFEIKSADLVLLAHEAGKRHQLFTPIKPEADEMEHCKS